jgi:hypothetical protein
MAIPPRYGSAAVGCLFDDVAIFSGSGAAAPTTLRVNKDTPVADRSTLIS